MTWLVNFLVPIYKNPLNTHKTTTKKQLLSKARTGTSHGKAVHPYALQQTRHGSPWLRMTPQVHTTHSSSAVVHQAPDLAFKKENIFHKKIQQISIRSKIYNAEWCMNVTCRECYECMISSGFFFSNYIFANKNYHQYLDVNHFLPLQCAGEAMAPHQPHKQVNLIRLE